MEAFTYALKWSEAILRWGHVLFAILWVGNSFLFNYLDNKLNKNITSKNIDGEGYLMHSGFFYKLSRLKVSPDKTYLNQLVIFKWQSYLTFVTGMLLLAVLYYYNSGVLMVDKRVLIFSLPGAFTPTCSSQQLPAFDEKFDDFKKMGIDEIFCISVNDSYVMNAWSNYMGVKNVQMIPDGTGQFTRMMGMLVNKDHNGFGMRSWRYAVIANNMEIEQSFVEKGLNDIGIDNDPYIETNPDNIIEFLK